MKKTIYIIVISVITCAAIIFGTWKHLGGFFKEFSFLGHSLENRAEEKRISDTILLEDFNNLNIDFKIADLEIKTGEKSQIFYECFYSNLVPVCKNENGTLRISQNGSSKNFPKSDLKCKVILTIPSGSDLSKLCVNIDIGELKIDSVCADSFVLNLDIGEIKVSNCDFSNGEFTTDIGDISIRGLSKDDFSYNLTVDIGEVSFFGKDQKKVKIKNEKSDKSLTADVSIGEIKIF